MKRVVSMLMLLVLLTSVLAACGAPATDSSTASPAGDTTASAAPASDAAEPSEEAEASVEASEEASAEPSAEAAASPADEEETAAADETGTPAGAALPDVSALAADLGTIKIATQGPLSGPQAAFGTTARQGAELAVEQIGEQIGFQNLELAPFDDQAQESVGASNANTLVTDQDIMCVVGHINSGVALGALPTYQDANVVMISPANTNPRITEDFDDTAYRLVGRDDVQGVVAAEFAQNTLGATSVYVLHDQSAYGEGLATVFRDTAEANGLQVLGFAGTQETSAFDSVLTPIEAANPDLVFWGGIYDRGGPLLQQMRDRGIEAEFLGGDGLDSSELARLAGESVVGANYVTVSGPPSAYPEAAQFLEDYQAAYNAPGGYPALQAYDATRACLVAIANAALEANGRPTREQVKAAFGELEPFEGVTGSVAFNEQGDRDPATYYVLRAVSANPDEWNTNEVADTIEVAPPTE